jgi:hypothetical protein
METTMARRATAPVALLADRIAAYSLGTETCRTARCQSHRHMRSARASPACALRRGIVQPVAFGAIHPASSGTVALSPETPVKALTVGALCAFASLAYAGSSVPSSIAVVSIGSGQRVQGSGRIVEDHRQLANFTAVRLDGPVDLELRLSEHDRVIVRTDDNIAPLIETRVTAGDRPTLEIGVRPGAAFRVRRVPVVVVEFRALSELVMRGSGNATADRIHAEDFALSMNGSGDARIEALEAKRFAAAVSGSGDLTVAGNADEQAFRIAGSGDVNARRLQGRTVLVAIAGSGDASVHATEALDVTIAGSGDVVYRGSPRIVQRIRGSGSVHRAH